MLTYKVSLKTVLLHNKNKFPVVLLNSAANMREEWENINLPLQINKYDKHKGIMRGDLKVTVF